MIGKIRACREALRLAGSGAGVEGHREMLLLARTHSYQAGESLKDTIARARAYKRAGADGVWLDDFFTKPQLQQGARGAQGSNEWWLPESDDVWLESKAGKARLQTLLAVGLAEMGGATPWLRADELWSMGYQMILYTTSLVCKGSWEIKRGLNWIKSYRPLRTREAMTLEDLAALLGLDTMTHLDGYNTRNKPPDASGEPEEELEPGRARLTLPNGQDGSEKLWEPVEGEGGDINFLD